MAYQPTKGKWGLVRKYQDDIDAWVWWVHVENSEYAAYVCGISPIYTLPTSKGSRIKRHHDKELANANLLKESKNMAKALLILKDRQELSDKAFKEKWGELDPWKYANEVLKAAKAPEVGEPELMQHSDGTRPYASLIQKRIEKEQELIVLGSLP